MAMLKITKVIREFVELKEDENEGHSYGQLLDDHLAETAMAGGEVQSVEFMLDEETWARYCRAVREAEQNGTIMPKRKSKDPQRAY